MKLKDIAEIAGVSAVTVSNVINGNYNKVSKETIERVQKIIEENDYRPNATARSLALKESKIIGVVVPYIGEDKTFSSSPYNTQMLALLERHIRRQGYYLMMRSVQKSVDALPFFSTWNVDGMIFFGTGKEEVEEIKKRIKVPAVYIDAYADDQKIASVGIDDYKGGYLAARYLLGKGHRQIAFVGPNINSPGVIQARYQGFCKACRERGIEITEANCFEAETLYEEGVSVGRKIAFADTDDVSIVGFDNLPECQYSHPQLTSVSQNLEKKAQLVGMQLFKMIKNKEKESVHHHVDVEIVERQSVKQLFAN